MSTAAPDDEARVKILRDFYWKARQDFTDDFMRIAYPIPEGQDRGVNTGVP